jgi:hypothetical protein
VPVSNGESLSSFSTLAVLLPSSFSLVQPHRNRAMSNISIKLSMLASIALLAACNKPATEQQAVVSAAPVETSVAPAAAAPAPAPILTEYSVSAVPKIGSHCSLDDINGGPFANAKVAQSGMCPSADGLSTPPTRSRMTCAS